MSHHHATLHWHRDTGEFLQGRYSRRHTWTFDGGTTVAASPSPSVVPAPFSDPSCVDPEEAFVASVASCHMLTFLFLASRKGFVVDDYRDSAVGTMTRNEKGVPWVSEIRLRPAIAYGAGKRPTADEERDLHHRAHEQCFIANSIRTEVRIEGPPQEPASPPATPPTAG